jgi:hypothetical protein
MLAGCRDWFKQKKVRYILNLAENEDCMQGIDYAIEPGTRIERVMIHMA